MRQPVEACFGYGAARLPICAVPYPSRSATLPLWAGLGYLVGELFQAHSWTGLRRAATSTGIFALFTVLAIATALTVVQSDPETGGVQIVAFQTPEPKPAELVAPPEPSPPARKPKPAPLPPPSPEKVAPEPELARKLQVIPPRAPEAPRVAPKPRPAARREAKRPERVPDRPELRIDALAVAPRAPEPPPARLLTARAAAPSVPLPSPDLAPLTRPADERKVTTASDRALRARPSAPSRAAAAPSFGLAAPQGSESAGSSEYARVARARRQGTRIDTGRPLIPQITPGPAPLPSESLELSRATPRAPRMARAGSHTSLAPGGLAPPLPAAPRRASTAGPTGSRTPSDRGTDDRRCCGAQAPQRPGKPPARRSARIARRLRLRQARGFPQAEGHRGRYYAEGMRK